MTRYLFNLFANSFLARVASLEQRPVPPTVVTAAATLSISSLANGATQISNVTVTGAVVGDYVQITGTDAGSTGTSMTYSGRVVSADTVQVAVTNYNGSAINFTASLKFRVTKP